MVERTMQNNWTQTQTKEKEDIEGYVLTSVSVVRPYRDFRGPFSKRMLRAQISSPHLSKAP